MCVIAICSPLRRFRFLPMFLPVGMILLLCGTSSSTATGRPSSRYVEVACSGADEQLFCWEENARGERTSLPQGVSCMNWGLGGECTCCQVSAPDSDGDGISDAAEGVGDSDSDGIAAYLDPDSDADDVPDAEEGTADSDSDGIADYLGPVADCNTRPDLLQMCWAATALPQSVDCSGWEGSAELCACCPRVPPQPRSGRSFGGDPADSDSDGVGDIDDPDSDGDGISNAVEGTLDADSDGIGDHLDTDFDGDGIGDAEVFPHPARQERYRNEHRTPPGWSSHATTRENCPSGDSGVFCPESWCPDGAFPQGVYINFQNSTQSINNLGGQPGGPNVTCSHGELDNWIGQTCDCGCGCQCDGKCPEPGACAEEELRYSEVALLFDGTGAEPITADLVVTNITAYTPWSSSQNGRQEYGTFGQINLRKGTSTDFRFEFVLPSALRGTGSLSIDYPYEFCFYDFDNAMSNNMARGSL